MRLLLLTWCSLLLLLITLAAAQDQECESDLTAAEVANEDVDDVGYAEQQEEDEDDDDDEYDEEDDEDDEEEDDDDDQNVEHTKLECVDRHPDCAEWAAQGECKNNPRYMLYKCKLSCGTCETVCIRLPGQEPVLKPGTLNVLMGRVLEKATQYKPHVISSDPWLVVFEDFLSSQECDELEQQAGKEYMPSREVIDNEPAENGQLKALKSAYRTSETSFCVEECDELEIVNRIQRRVEDLLEIPKDNFEYIQLVRYFEGQYYKVHHDTSPLYIDMPMGHRIFTMFFYLNDVSDGGETEFPNVNGGTKVTPRKGRAVLWSNVYNDNPDKADLRTEHSALPVGPNIQKNGANFWIYQYDYRTPWKVGCTG